MSIMAALPRPSPRPSRRSQSPNDVPPNVLQPSLTSRPFKRKRDHSPHRKSSVRKHYNVHQARQSLITTHYPARSIPFPPPHHIQVNASPHSPLLTSLGAPTTLKDDGPNDKIDRRPAEQHITQHGVEVGKKMEDKRSLRSHDGGSRSKSELAQYFANYEDLLSFESKEASKSTLWQSMTHCRNFTDGESRSNPRHATVHY